MKEQLYWAYSSVHQFAEHVPCEGPQKQRGTFFVVRKLTCQRETERPPAAQSSGCTCPQCSGAQGALRLPQAVTQGRDAGP